MANRKGGQSGGQGYLPLVTDRVILPSRAHSRREGRRQFQETSPGTLPRPRSHRVRCSTRPGRKAECCEKTGKRGTRSCLFSSAGRAFGERETRSSADRGVAAAARQVNCANRTLSSHRRSSSELVHQPFERRPQRPTAYGEQVFDAVACREGCRPPTVPGERLDTGMGDGATAPLLNELRKNFRFFGGRSQVGCL